ncbi:Gfo/Idh/MocA family oxidoreductase [Streptomyces sp. NPDC058818]|uniref:Gfo/Idh/MocA family oxidoreductase n=1 Tax=Streptomyces sp. NPDC058818 TaxID=3346640 RepID=UPI0036CAFA94
MRVLIVGLGYAGTRFLNAFSRTATETEFAYVGRNPKDSSLPYYDSTTRALAEFRPDVVVVTVPDMAHAEILSELDGYQGFVLAEKPLALPGESLDEIESHLREVSGFCMDLVERYSDATRVLRAHVLERDLRLVRAHFTWGKDRINDHRPTSGVQSEVIHPLDLVQWIAGRGAGLELESVLGTRSDFSVSGDAVLDSVALSARLDEGRVTGYSSFVNITRSRAIDFVFRDPQGELTYAGAVYDTPAWDADRLRVWRRTSSGDEVFREVDTREEPVPDEARTIVKLSRMAEDVTEFVVRGRQPASPFPGLPDALSLQRLLNTVDAQVNSADPVTYFPAGRTVLQEADLERLG